MHNAPQASPQLEEIVENNTTFFSSEIPTPQRTPLEPKIHTSNQTKLKEPVNKRKLTYTNSDTFATQNHENQHAPGKPS